MACFVAISRFCPDYNFDHQVTLNHGFRIFLLAVQIDIVIFFIHLTISSPAVLSLLLFRLSHALSLRSAEPDQLRFGLQGS